MIFYVGISMIFNVGCSRQEIIFICGGGISKIPRKSLPQKLILLHMGAKIGFCGIWPRDLDAGFWVIERVIFGSSRTNPASKSRKKLLRLWAWRVERFLLPPISSRHVLAPSSMHPSSITIFCFCHRPSTIAITTYQLSISKPNFRPYSQIGIYTIITFSMQCLPFSYCPSSLSFLLVRCWCRRPPPRAHHYRLLQLSWWLPRLHLLLYLPLTSSPKLSQLWILHQKKNRVWQWHRQWLYISSVMNLHVDQTWHYLHRTH